ncbi:MAG TPA: NAD-dependent epimerase/dehydratase family protein [Bacteroidia bacterium]|nr:NAD-dependent epimerase/dehydratase family protein [Bacteroidia bacterium]
MEKVFVTGPDGLLGNHVVRDLIRRGYSVVAMVQTGRKAPSLEGLGLEVVFGEITNKAEVTALSAGCKYFIHIAAITDVWPSKGDKYFRVNVGGTANAVSAALKNKVARFIHIGSASSFRSGNEDKPGTEKESYRFTEYNMDYMKSKHMAQEYVLNAVKHDGLPGIVLCPTFMIGAYDSKPSSGAMLIAVARKKLPYVAGGGKNWVSAKNVASAVCNALEKGRPGECYILGGENVSYRQMVSAISNVVGGYHTPRPVIPKTLVLGAGLLSSVFARAFRTTPKISLPMAQMACVRHYYDPSKAISELEMPQEPIESAIAESHRWFLENGYL